MRQEIVLGAVAYDAKVVPIWDGFQAWFRARGVPFDYVLYTTYERQVEALLWGHIDVAWHSPLAWVQTRRAAERLGRTARAVAMRDTDRDLTSVIVVPAGSAVVDLDGLSGAMVGVGAVDSPQATLLPMELLASSGVECRFVRHDVLVGKHGDHIGGERDAARALRRGDVDAACLLDANLVAFAADGTLPAGSVRVVGRTPRYDHCNFTVLDDTDVAPMIEGLLSMLWDDPAVRGLMDMEGLRAWVPGRTEGYAPLEAACDRFGTVDAFVQRLTR